MRKEIAGVQDIIDHILDNLAIVKVLEAGCGSATHLDFGAQAHIVGIDISERQLQRNAMLNEKIRGDIQDYDFQPSTFDMIVCWDVLEHLPRPEKALQRFASTLKEDGIIILKLPNVFSLKGLVTKYLPHPLHILFYKYVHKKENVGKDDIGPFKTYLKAATAPSSIRAFAANNALSVLYFASYDILTVDWFRKNRIVWTMYAILKALAGWVSLGHLGNSEFIMVLKKAPRN